MDNKIIHQLLEETISLIEEEEIDGTKTLTKFCQLVHEYLPQDVLNQLEEIFDGNEYLEDIWRERYEVIESKEDDEIDTIPAGYCLICERKVKLTKHHLFPREMHKNLTKKGYDDNALNLTIAICKMCHATIHRFFTNEELAQSYYSIDLLLEDEKFLKYAKWASAQADGRHKKVRG